MVRKKNRKVFGIGVNNADYTLYRSEKIKGKWKKVWVCPYYVVWKDMLKRCYSMVFLKKYPTYRGCSVCDDWIYFMTFKAWMEKQDWEGKHLDKDILVEGNKVYSPETCRFVDSNINLFLGDCAASRGLWPLGVSWRKDINKFQAHCRNPFTLKKEYLGHFTCPQAAHEAWRRRKQRYATMLADIQSDLRIAEALRKRFAPKEGGC
jgi:hypothetical protein